MRTTPLLLLVAGLSAVACVPERVLHYDTTLTPLATCRVEQGRDVCQGTADGGITITGVMSVEERGDQTRVFFRQDTLVGSDDGDRFHVEKEQEVVHQREGCRTVRRFVMDGLKDDPGFGLRRQVTGSAEESSVTDGEPRVCGRNIPFGDRTRYRMHAVEVNQP